MRIEAILLFTILISSVYTASAYAQSPPKAQIVVTSITQVTPVIVANSPNNQFITSVTNTGNAAGTKSITMVMYQNYGSDNESTHACTTLSGLYEASITLNPGESTSTYWICTVYDPGVYQVRSLGKTLDFQVSADQGKLYVSKVTVDPIKPKLGDNAVFTVTVKNFNAIHGSKNISYKLTFYSTPTFDASFGTKSITLGPDGSTTFTVDAVFSSSDPWRFYADDYVYDPIVEEAKMQLKKDVEEEKKIEQEEKTEQEEEEIDDTDEIEEEEIQVSGSKLVVTDVVITPRKNLKPGDIVTITVVVANVGDIEGTKSLVPVINAPIAGKSAMVEAQSVTIKPGKEKTVSWQIPILVSGIYDVFVEGSSSSFQVKSTTQDTKKSTDTSDKKKFDIDDAADFTNGGVKISIDPIPEEITDDVIKILKKHNEQYNKKQADSPDKKKFDIDDASNFDTYGGESGPSEDGLLSSEDLDRIKNVSDMQVINDMESIRNKILSVDFGTLYDASGIKSESDKISQKYDAANEKLRIAIENRKQIVGLKEQLEKEKEKAKELEKQYNSDFNRWKKIWKENKDGKPSMDDKVRENEALEDQYESQEKWEASGGEIHKIENKIRELEPDANKQYDDAMKDLDSVSDELNKFMEEEPNYEDKNQKPFVTDDLKKETYQNPSRTVEDLMRITEESIKNMDALQKQNTLKQIIRETSDQAASVDVYNKIVNSESASNPFYPGDLESLMSVTPRAEFQDATWAALSDSGDLEKYKQKTLKKLEQKSESNAQQISTQSPLVNKLQDSSYFGTIPSTSETEDVTTIMFSGYSMGFGNNLISADIPIKSIFDDGNTAKYSVLGGNLVIVDSSTNEIKDIHSVAFGKGRVDHQSGKMTFLINSVDSSGQHQTITLNSAELSASIYSGYQVSDMPLTFSTYVSGGDAFKISDMSMSNSLFIDDAESQLYDVILSKMLEESALTFGGATKYIPTVDEWKKLVEKKNLAEQKKKEAFKKLNDAKQKFEESLDPKLRDELKKTEQDLEKEKDPDKRRALGHKLNQLSSEAYNSGDKSLREKIDAADREFSEAYHEHQDASIKERKARNIIDDEAKSGRIDKTGGTGGY